ncbi:hypothetical protein [Tabrizicola sp.]|uniref:hypothetical protein n=1 Tax=Tabrizicola sp. TaxID=2005166 RepID=UPI002FDF0610
MVLITGIRAPVPVAEMPTFATTGSGPQASMGAEAPVATPALAQAVQQTRPKSAANDPQLIEARMTAETSAAAAAEAAREAYIKASIAAGINPLPLS